MDGGVCERVSSSSTNRSAQYRESLVTQWVTTCKCYCPHHMTSGTFQGGYSAMFIASRRVLKGARRVLYPPKQSREDTGPLCTTFWLKIGGFKKSTQRGHL